MIVRCMPNLPAMIDLGITALFATENVSESQRSAADGILAAVGETVWVEREDDLDAVTALSGTGPAYYFLLTEIMQKRSNSSVYMGGGKRSDEMSDYDEIED